MSADGAHLGLNAQDAMGAILAGESTEGKAVTTAEMFQRIMHTEYTPGAFDYGTCADYAARLIIEFWQADPKRTQIPTENVYALDDDGYIKWVDGEATVVTPGLYEAMKANGSIISGLDLTGFMWGWAVNAARACMELPPVPNPAIVETGGA